MSQLFVVGLAGAVAMLIIVDGIYAAVDLLVDLIDEARKRYL